MDPNQKCQEAKLTVKEVEVQVNRIMTASKADKQQMFFKLLKRLGLPMHSSDVHARGLSYPEMFYRVQQWIQNERADRRAQKMVWATFLAVLSAAISTACALVALLKD